jgi:hypothetical protein
MRSSKLCEHLFLLDQKGRSKFHDFLRSPYFSVKEDAEMLYAVLDQYILPYQSRNLTEEECFAKVFPEKPFNANQFRKLKTRLLGHFFEFITAEDKHRENMDKHLAALKFFQEKGEIRFFESQFKSAVTELESIEWQDENCLAREVELEYLRLKAEVNHGLRNKDNNLRRLFHLLQAHDDFRWIRYAYVRLNQMRVFSNWEDEEKEFLEKFVRSAADRVAAATESFQTNYYLCLTLLEPNETTHFFSFLNLLNTHSQSIPFPERSDLYTGALNYCIRKINAGKVEFRETLFELYQRMIEMEIIQHQGEGTFGGHFKNIVSVGTRLGKFEWLEQFIEKESKHLPTDNREEILNFNRGVVAFYRGEYQRAESLLNHSMAGLDDIFYSLDTRFYLLRIYYETGNDVGMESLTHAFRIYILRHAMLTDGRRERYLEFLKLFRRLYQTPPFAKDKILRLKDEVEAATKYSWTEWLMEKLDAILERN